MFGPAFLSELRAAGVAKVSWDVTTGEIYGRDALTDQERATLAAVIAAHDPTRQPPLQLGQVVTYPGEFWLRCTEAEAEMITATAANMTVREQQIFNRATVFDHAVPETQRLLSLLTAAFGADRAAVLLAPSA